MTHHVRVLFFASLAGRLGVREAALQVPAGTTVDQAVGELIRRHPGLEEARDGLAYAVNLEYVAPEHALADGDELALIPPVSGG